tara:strand:+ start:376 stop:1704 length:1329 start_codon:yes stop_codon:yes gene_type:complete
MLEENGHKRLFLPGFEMEEIDKSTSDLTIEEQWQYFQDTVDLNKIPNISNEELKEIILSDLYFISSMDVKEYTLYQKWLEIHKKYQTVSMYSFIDGRPALKNISQGSFIKKIKDNIWTPNNVDDYLNISPELVLATDKNTKIKEWSELRIFIHTQRNNSNIGRNLYFIVSDKKTKKYLGLICASSDFLDLSLRDKHIGWDRVRKTKKMIKHTTIGSSIVPVQPLGYNYVGGKLLALLCLSDPIQKTWKEQYGDTLVGVTTTSLYGKTKTVPLSQYDRLKYWKKMGFTKGSVSYETSRETRTKIEQWLMKNHTYKYFEWYFATGKTGPYKRDHRNRSFTFTFNKLGIPKESYKSDHSRGVYFSELYDNTKEFLREEIGENKLIKSFDTSVEYLTNLWKTKYAGKRINNLVNQERVSTESLFYDDIIYMTWEETKKKYLHNVGR